jgi:hypothetical protein
MCDNRAQPSPFRRSWNAAFMELFTWATTAEKDGTWNLLEVALFTLSFAATLRGNTSRWEATASKLRSVGHCKKASPDITSFISCF